MLKIQQKMTNYLEKIVVDKSLPLSKVKIISQNLNF